MSYPRPIPPELIARVAVLGQNIAAVVDDDRWKENAECRGMPPDWFFPPKGDPHPLGMAACQRCEVRAECLAYALALAERYGSWGGVSEKQRRMLRRRNLVPLRTLEPVTPPGPKAGQINHGTDSGYAQHHQRGVPVCDDCRRAHTEAQRRARGRGDAA